MRDASYLPSVPPTSRPTATQSRSPGLVKTRSAHGGPPPESGVALLATTPASAPAAMSAGTRSAGMSAPRRSSARSATATPEREERRDGEEQPVAPACCAHALRHARLDVVVARRGRPQLVAQVVEHRRQLGLRASTRASGTRSPSRRCIAFRPRDTRTDDVRRRLEVGRDLGVVALLEHAGADRRGLIGPHRVQRLAQALAQGLHCGLPMQVLDVVGAEAPPLEARPHDGGLLGPALAPVAVQQAPRDRSSQPCSSSALRPRNWRRRSSARAKVSAIGPEPVRDRTRGARSTPRRE